MPICLWIVYRCIHAKMAELSSCNTDLQCLNYLLSGCLQKRIADPYSRECWWGPTQIFLSSRSVHPPAAWVIADKGQQLLPSLPLAKWEVPLPRSYVPPHTQKVSSQPVTNIRAQKTSPLSQGVTNSAVHIMLQRAPWDRADAKSPAESTSLLTSLTCPSLLPSLPFAWELSLNEALVQYFKLGNPT